MDIQFNKIRLSDRIVAFVDCVGYPSYVLEGSEKVLLVDSGFGITDLRACIEKEYGKPILLVNTHGHVDHCGGNCFFDAAYIGAEDLTLSKQADRKTKLQMATTKISDPAVLARLEACLPEDKTYVTVVVRDGQLLDLGDCTVRCVTTPGHTQGSVCFFYEQEKILFSGDMVKPEGVWMFLQESTDMQTYLKSLQKLQKLPVEKICPGHHPVFVGREMLISLVQCAEKILADPENGQEATTFMGPCKMQSVREGAIYY